jgi:hypothetical protein
MSKLTMANNTMADEHAMGAIRLQSVGLVAARPAATLEVGDWLMWNGGAMYQVLAIRDISRCFIEVEEANRETGEVFTRKLKKDRMVATPQRPWRGTDSSS